MMDDTRGINTKYPLVFVIALGAGVLMIQMSGFMSVATGPDPTSGLESPGKLNSSAENASGIEGDASSSNDGDIVGLIISGVSNFGRLLGMYVLLPWELMDLGLPRYAAYPIGVITQILGGIALWQLAGNRVFR